MINEEQTTKLRIMHFISVFVEENKFPPTIREIAKGVGLKSSSTVKGHLDRLKRDGYLSFMTDSPRTLVILKELDDE